MYFIFFIVFSSQGYIHGEVGIKNLVFKGVKALEFEKEKKRKKKSKSVPLLGKLHADVN